MSSWCEAKQDLKTVPLAGYDRSAYCERIAHDRTVSHNAVIRIPGITASATPHLLEVAWGHQHGSQAARPIGDETPTLNFSTHLPSWRARVRPENDLVAGPSRL